MIRVASSPRSFGVDAALGEGWWPEPDEMLDWMVELDYAGTELGPPGFLGTGPEVRERLTSRGLELVGALLPQRFSRNEHTDEDRAWLRRTLELIDEASPGGSRPPAILVDGMGESVRHAYTGRIEAHPEAWLSAAQFAALIDNIHGAAEICLDAGFEPVIHPHAGTYIETADEIARVMDRIDPSLIGLCLDTGHFRYGGADPAQSIHDYASILRHVHLKDCDLSALSEVVGERDPLAEALRRGVFCPLGEGDAGIDRAILALHSIRYDGWVVVEQDQLLGARDTAASVVDGQRRNREYLRARFMA